MPSFGEAADFFDSVDSAMGMRRLASTLRWPTGAPPETLALRSLLGRFSDPHKVTRRLLFYNTFLIPGLVIPLKDFIIEVLIPDIPGIPDPHDLIETVLEWLSSFVPTGRITIRPAPAMKERAAELGSAILADYDIAALCEAFDSEERALIIHAWPRDARPDREIGPDVSGNWVVASSGLMTICPRGSITRKARHTFRQRGDRLRDVDAWANKGVLLTEIDFGLVRGRLELYSTHLFSGGTDGQLRRRSQDTLFGRIEVGGEPTDLQRLEIRLGQVNEAVDFIRRTHRPENVAMLVGDFNINAHEGAALRIDGITATPYEHLKRTLRALDMHDLWEALSPAADANPTTGYTSNIKSRGRDICPVDARHPQYCDELTPPRRAGQRIDYVFVERQNQQHAFILDLTRPRRVPFERPPNAPGRDEVPFLSDHIGLELTLVATPL